MVCKEDVLSWFKDLDSYKRIDMLYELLNMCLPFELRFLGSCVEEIGKQTYQELRGPAIIANDYDKLSKDTTLNQNLLDDNVRHRILIYLSLLSSRNYTVANWLYKNHLRTEWIEDFIVKSSVKCESFVSELLLLYTMALHHPAFTFEQKYFFGNVLTKFVDSKDNVNRLSPKPSVYGYPPGFGYPAQKLMNIVENTMIPTKTAMPMSHGDINIHQHPPGLTHLPPQQPLDYISTIWSRPGFHCGAPEPRRYRGNRHKVPPFPPPPAISPLVSQSGTPTHSRSTSPHRTAIHLRGTHTARPPPPPVPPQSVDVMSPIHQQPPPDQLSHSNIPMYNSEMKLPDDDLPQMQECHIDTPWAPQRGMIGDNHKQPPNGLCYPPYHQKMPTPYIIEQMQSLNLEGENSLHHSNSSSSSSLNQSPPETPSVTPHGPGRGEKPRVNGVPPSFANNLLPMCDGTPPPPPPSAFNNCTVPYTSYPATFNQMPNRSIFPTFCRPPFTTPFHNFTTENSIPQYTVPYVSIIYSSPPTYLTRQQPPNCYNCGGSGHVGPECPAQNIEEITQKKSYALDFAALHDVDK